MRVLVVDAELGAFVLPCDDLEDEIAIGIDLEIFKSVKKLPDFYFTGKEADDIDTLSTASLWPLLVKSESLYWAGLNFGCDLTMKSTSEHSGPELKTWDHSNLTLSYAMRMALGGP